MKRFLAIYIGTDAARARSQWGKLDEEKRKELEAAGMQAWMDWGVTQAPRSSIRERRSERRSARRQTASRTSRTP